MAVNLDQKQPGFPAEVLPRYLSGLGVPFHIIEQDTYAVVKRVIPEGKTMCGLCSRLRRGALYRHAAENGITKIALGHHRDDIVETLFLNMFFGGRLKAMPPKLLSEDRRHIVIRPLAYVPERALSRYAAARGFPIIPCTLCGSQTNMQRLAVKRMLKEWEEQFPGRVESIFSSICNASASQLADPSLFDFAGLERERLRAGRNLADQNIADRNMPDQSIADLNMAGRDMAHQSLADKDMADLDMADRDMAELDARVETDPAALHAALP